jgi:hypothetical protein
MVDMERQQSIKWGVAEYEKAAMSIVDLVKPFDDKTNAVDITEATEIIKGVFAAGRAEGVRECDKAIMKLPKRRIQSDTGRIDWLIKLNDILTALEGVGKEG